MSDELRELYRFTKPGHVAEIKERHLTLLDSREWSVFIDGSQVDCRLYLKYREDLFERELLERVAALKAEGWVEDRGAAGNP